jgi:polar amino acid transport system substrate-binding protein
LQLDTITYGSLRFVTGSQDKPTPRNGANVKKQTSLFLALVVASALAITGCSKAETSDSATSASCAKADLATVESGKLTIATGEPAYYPWILDDKPETGTGFEGAVAYAVAKQLGFTNDEVTWVRTTFDGAVTPGEKNFDFNLQQFSITADRQKVVDFSSPYYTAPQAIVSYEGSKIAGKTSIAELKDAKLGAAVGTTSLDAIENQIGIKPQVFNDNAAGVSALKNGQIDGLVVDLPTAFYLSGVEVDKGIIVGQLPSTGTGDQFGLLLAKDSALTACVSAAVDAITADGTLAAITEKWLATETGSAVLKP